MSTSAFARAARLPRGGGGPQRVALQVAGGLLVAAFAALIVLYAVRGTSLKGVAVAIVALGSVWFLTTRKPQLALAVFVLYLGLLDGYLKLASGSSVVTFVRDAFLFSLVIGLLVRAAVTRQRLPVPPLAGYLVAFTVIVFVEFANPHAGTLAHSVAGARQHLEFVPLFFLTFAFVRTTRALRGFCVLLAVIAAANGIVGWIQFRETPQQFAAWGPGYSERVLGTGAFAGAGRTAAVGATGSATRPFGLGSDAGDGGLFAMVALCGIFALAAFSRRLRYQLFAVAMAVLALVAIVTSQGRTDVLGSIISVLAFAALTLRSGSRTKSLSGLVLIVVVGAFVVSGVVAAAGSGGLRYAGLGPSSLLNTTSTARGPSIANIPLNMIHYPFGVGLGTAGPASGTSGQSAFQANTSLDTETEFSFLTIETGVPGMAVLTAFLIVLISIGFKRVSQEPDAEARILLAALIAPLTAIFVQFFISALTPSVPLGPYLFAAGGIVAYWLIELPAARARETAQVLPPVLTPGAAVPAIAVPSSTA